MPQVVLLPPIPQENNRSMAVYAKELAAHYRKLGLPYLPTIAEPAITIQDAARPYPIPLRTELPPLWRAKYGIYPEKLLGYSRHIAHIVDHSYGHLVHALDPARTIITCHDLTLLHFAEKIIRSEEDRDKLDLFKYSLNGMQHAAALIADSKATQKDMETLLGIPQEKVRVIPLGVSEDIRKTPDLPELEEYRKKYWLEGTLTILHVGNNHFYKNIGFLFKILYTLVKKYGLPVRLLKAGADLTEMQKMQLRTFDLTGHILHLGEVSKKQLLTLYNLCDVYCAPSLNEGFGLPVLEAMACGMPVIVSDRGSLPALVGRAGIVLPIKDHELWAQEIKELFMNKHKKEAIGHQCLERSKDFSWNNTANLTFEVYQRIAHDIGAQD